MKKLLNRKEVEKMPLVQMKSGGRLVIPKEVREEAKIKEGDFLEVKVEKGKVIITPKMIVDRVELSEKGEKMLEEALKEVKEGKIRKFDQLEQLFKELYEENNQD
jgi:AbrB family looped-hinge helix DNA binding protein